jgi:hypothetical protein
MYHKIYDEMQEAHNLLFDSVIILQPFIQCSHVVYLQEENKKLQMEVVYLKNRILQLDTWLTALKQSDKYEH